LLCFILSIISGFAFFYATPCNEICLDWTGYYHCQLFSSTMIISFFVGIISLSYSLIHKPQPKQEAEND